MKRSGGKFLRADAHPMRGCSENGQDILTALTSGKGLNADATPTDNDGKWTEPKDVILMGFSKGSPDVLTFLVEHPEWASRTRAIISWAGANMGSPSADAAWQVAKDWDVQTAVSKIGQIFDWIHPAINVRRGPLARVDEMRPLDGVESLTTTYREEWFKKHKQELMDMKIPTFYVTGATTVDDVPHFQAGGYLALSMFDANNDMQLTTANASINIPIAVNLGMVNGNHWDMSYGPFATGMCLGSNKLEHPFPKHAAMKAFTMLLDEMGLMGH